MLDQRSLMYKGLSQTVASIFSSRSHIVASVNFDSTFLYVAAILILAASLGRRLLVLHKDFLMAEFEFMQVNEGEKNF